MTACAGTDLLARLIAKGATAKLGQPVVVENKPGGGGAVAATTIARTEPDGYTIGMAVSSTFAFAPLASEKIRYQLDDFDYITSVAEFQTAILARSDAPFKTWQEMIAYAKDGHDLSFASPSPVVKMVMSVIAEQEGIRFRIIPVKGGKAAMKELLGGQVDLGWSAGIHQAYLKDGAIRVLAASGKRLNLNPDVPTLGELGYDFNATGYFLFFAPKGIPQERMKRLSGVLQEAARSEKVIDVVSNRMRFPSLVIGPEEPRADLERLSGIYAQLIKQASALVAK